MIDRNPDPDMPLFHARNTDPATSHAAAKKADEFRDDHCERIKAALAKGDGTIYEIGARAKLDHHAVARRMPELQRAGACEPTDVKRKSPKGTPCRVWRRK